MINVNGWRPISEYDRNKYDWVLVKCKDGEDWCVPVVAEMRADGKWYGMGKLCNSFLPFYPMVFFDMQQLDIMA
jgi:hypothetical protein